MSEIDAHGIRVEVPPGWEGRIFRRAEAGQPSAAEVSGAAAPPGERTFPLMHVATIALPMDVADFASDVVTDLGSQDALIILKEFDPAAAGQALFAQAGLTRVLDTNAVSPATLQRRVEGQAGYQSFFHESGRAFCLYVVIGGYDLRNQVVPKVNKVLDTIAIAPTPPGP